MRADRSRPTFIVSQDQDGRRLDRVLRGLYPSVPLGAIMKYIRTGDVRIDGRKVPANIRLVRGSEVAVPWGDAAHELVHSNVSDVPLIKTLYKDDDIIAVSKPVGLLSQPSEQGGDSLIGRILRELSWDRSDFRPALIGRLDRNVSGISIAALNYPTLRAASECMRNGTIRKIYRAVVEGSPKGSGTIDIPLKKNARENTVSCDPSGKHALTRYRVVERASGHALVELELVTGRPHQARAHMSAIGSPIYGDAKYGAVSRFGGRVALHALSMEFPDDPELPEQIRGICCTAPYPDDLQQLKDRLFGS